MKKGLSERVFDILNVLFMVCMMLFTLYPFLYVLFASMSDPASIAQNRGPMLYPHGFNLTAYKKVIEYPMIRIGYANTLFYLLTGTAINIILTSMGGYVLSRKGFLLKKLFMFLIVFTMFFGGGLIPLFLVVMQLGLVNSRLAVILVPAISTGNLIIMRTYFMSIPDSIEESVRIDGANDFTILLWIILPLSLPVVAVMTLFYGVSNWNSWFNAVIFLQSREKLPLQVILREILISYSTESMASTSRENTLIMSESLKYATIIISSLPMLIIYPFLQKYFVKGIMIGSLKE